MSNTQIVNLSITIKFIGGAEYLFGNKKVIEAELPARNSQTDGSWTIKDLLIWLKENHLKERPEMFLQEDSVRPGILVLVNDVDWELLGQTDYEIKNNDAILFMSTLHGG